MSEISTETNLQCTITYIYALIDPITSEIRYVGQTVTPAKRFTNHVSKVNCKRDRSQKASWIKSLQNKGLRPTFKLLESCSTEISHLREDDWIALYRARGHNITNLEAPAKSPCLNRLQTKEEVQHNRLKQLERNQQERGVKYHGVHICNPNSKFPYRASLRIQTKRHHVGQYSDPKDAAKAWDSAVAYYFPEHTVFNFPEEVTPKSVEELKRYSKALQQRSSVYYGVSLNKKSGMWKVHFKVKEANQTVGTFKEEEEAALAYDALEKHYNPNSTRLNFPDENTQPMTTEEVRKYSRELKGLAPTKSSQYPYIFYQKRENKWAYELGTIRKSGFKTELEAVRGFNNYITTNYINKPILIIK